MQTVILAAGRGTRMQPLTDSIPKPMLPAGTRPLAAHAADLAVEAGSSELIFVVGFSGETVREFFGPEYRGVPITYVIQEKQRGTADAVSAAGPYIDGDFVVLNGDNLYDDSLEHLYESAPAIGSVRVSDPTNYGVLSTEGETVTGIVEKPADPPSTLANAGAYAFPEAAKRWLDVEESDRGEYELTAVISRLIREWQLTTIELDRWLDVGRPWELLAANEWKLGRIDRDVRGEVSSAAELRGPVVVESGATVEPGVLVEGPVLIREDATVGPNAYVRGHTYLGPETHVGASVEIKNSVIMAGTNVPHLSYVGDSILGCDVNLGAGTNVANLRHDGDPVRMTVDGERLSTGRRKFGIVAGDGTKTGINTSLDPGVKLSTDARTMPGECVSRDR